MRTRPSLTPLSKNADGFMPHQRFYFINQSAAVLMQIGTGKGRGVGRVGGFVPQAWTGKRGSAGEDAAAGDADQGWQLPPALQPSPPCHQAGQAPFKSW